MSKSMAEDQASAWNEAKKNCEDGISSQFLI
jgi:hypothetical protein